MPRITLCIYFFPSWERFGCLPLDGYGKQFCREQRHAALKRLQETCFVFLLLSFLVRSLTT